MELIERRVRDGSILRLIGKWINVGVLEDGRLLVTQTGVGQGQVISPLLANIYLHYGAAETAALLAGEGPAPAIGQSAG